MPQRTVILLAAAALALAACDGPPSAPSLSSAGPEAGPRQAGAGGDGGGDRLAALQRAELQRRAELVTEPDLASREVAVRRAAARALARIGSPAVRQALLRGLGDEDAQVVAWAAYGLGQSCEGHRAPTVSALVAAAARWSAPHDVVPTDAGAAAEPSVLLPASAIARAVGRCAAPESEATLLAWARGPDERAHAAIYGLGDLAQSGGRLREETFVALLKLAAGDAARPPMAVALYPLGRVAHLPPSVVERAREVASARLAEPGPARQFAIQALIRTDEAAVGVLAGVVRGAEGHSAAERALAARGLEQLGAPGQRALGELLTDLTPAAGPLPAAKLVGDEFGVLWTIVKAIDTVGRVGGRLRYLAALPVGADLPRPVRLRASLLRCAAASLLAERDFDSPLLKGCDLTEAPAADPQTLTELPPLAVRAVVQAIGMPGARIRAARRRAWDAVRATPDPVARAAAVSLIGDHPEVEGAHLVLAEALRSPMAGVVAAAAQVIAKAPLRAAAQRAKGKPDDAKAPSPPHPDVVAALLERLGGTGPTSDLEALAAVVDAAGALALDEARPQLRQLCSSPRPTIRSHAAAALSAILGGTEKVQCEPLKEGLALPKELASLVTSPVTLALETDAGALGLRLDPRYAPVAVTRIAALASRGFYDGLTVHRVEAGFVAQLGSPTADGFGAADDPALPCETSPVPFSAGGVGMALAGRDTGASQLFVTLATYPHLDGQYAWLGTATGPWAALAPGDVVRKVTVER